MTSTTITVTLKDAKGNATPGKLVNLSQTGNSVITGPTPQVTDSSGNIQFTATPFREDGSLDLDCARRLAAHILEDGSHGLVIAGTHIPDQLREFGFFDHRDT